MVLQALLEGVAVITTGGNRWYDSVTQPEVFVSATRACAFTNLTWVFNQSRLSDSLFPRIYPFRLFKLTTKSGNAKMPAIRGPKSKSKTRRRTRDMDQIHADVQDEKHLAEFKESKAAEDLPALGEWYCKSCAKWFDSGNNFEAHQKSKKHKKMSVIGRSMTYCS